MKACAETPEAVASAAAFSSTRSSRYSPELLTQLRNTTMPAMRSRYLSRINSANAPLSAIGSSSSAAARSGPRCAACLWIQTISATHTSRITTAASISACGPSGTSQLARRDPARAPTELPPPMIGNSRFPCSAV
jgi:hypothetical protein